MRAERSHSIMPARKRAWVAGSVPGSDPMTNVPRPGRARTRPSPSRYQSGAGSAIMAVPIPRKPILA